MPGHPAFDAVVARALAKDPAQRYGSGAELGAAALAAAGGSQPSAPLEAARRSERGIRAAAGPAVAAQAAAPLAALEHAGERARLLREALAETPPERIEQRLAEVRAGRDPGKARLVAALAQHLAVQRRMQAALEAFDAETERILLELETVRGRVLADDATAGERLAALQHELETLADGMAAAGGESDHPRVGTRGPLAPAPCRPMPTITERMRRKGRRRFIETYEFSPALHKKLVVELGDERTAGIALDGLRGWYLACLYADGR